MAGVTVDPIVRELSAVLLTDVGPLGERMAERIRAEEPYYRADHGVSLAELRRSCGDNLTYVLGSLADIPAPLDAPRETGRSRAAQGVPFEAVLQAFRIGGRFIWELLVEHADAAAHEVLLRSAADVWAVSDNLAMTVTSAYRDALDDRARVDGQVRAALLSDVLDGTGDSARRWDAARLLRLPRQGEFVAVSATCPSPGAEALPGVEALLRSADVGSAWRVDSERHEGVVVLRTRFGVERLADTMHDLAAGRVGISAPFATLDETAAALREARLACAAATPGSTELVRFDERPVAALLANTPDAALVLARTVLGKVLDLPEDDRALVVDTARTWLAEEGSTSAAAKRLFVHRNTVRYRLRRIEQLTGRSLTAPIDVSEIHLALECARILALA